MSISPLLKKFLGSGYLPKELPPTFSSRSMALNLPELLVSWVGDGKTAPFTRTDIFTIPRHGRHRRRLSIPNPISHFYLSKAISDNWVEIVKHIESSQISLFRSVTSDKSNRVFEPINFDDIEIRKNAILSRCDAALMTDISRYYPTIYTHSIAWALHGKAFCKQNLHNKAAKLLAGNILDDLVRRGQDGQSLGIPLGPDTSIVIAEIIGSAIDKELKKSIQLNDEIAFRYTDDFFIGLRDGRSAERTIADVATALSAFELELSIEKTRTLGAGSRADPDWALEISQFKLPVDVRRKRKSIEYYFKRSFHIAQAYPIQNVLSYAISRSRTFNIDESNWPGYEEFTLQCARANSTTVENVARILIEGDRDAMPLNRKWIEVFICDLLTKHSGLDHHWELCWLLFLARELRITIPESVVSDCQKVESSAVSLLLLDLGSRDLANVGSLKHRLVQDMSEVDLRTGEWLVLYEGARLGWLGEGAAKIVAAEKYFGVLLRNNVKFYLEKQTVPRLSKEQPNPTGGGYDPAYFRM
jgi:hypothetical protein